MRYIITIGRKIYGKNFASLQHAERYCNALAVTSKKRITITVK